MQDLIAEIQALFELYPSWLVTTCLVIVGLGVGYVLWRLIKIGMILVVTVLLIALVGFAGYMLFAS